MNKFYAVRQARTRVIGSRKMTLAEAEREVAVWREEIGPAVVVPASREVTHAVRVYDQEVLSGLLRGAQEHVPGRSTHDDLREVPRG